MFPHYITGPTTQREREKFCVRKLNFKIFIMPQWMNEWEDNISFVVLSCGLRETSRVDYTERRKTERKKEKCMFSPLHHRATTERRNIKRNKNETVFKFLLKYATMKFLRGQHKFCSFWSCVPTFLYGRLHREKKDWEKKGKCFPIT